MNTNCNGPERNNLESGRFKVAEKVKTVGTVLDSQANAFAWPATMIKRRKQKLDQNFVLIFSIDTVD